MGVISEAWETGQNVAKRVRDAAKRKKALAIADAGGYNTLTPYQKSLITDWTPITIDDVITVVDRNLIGAGVAPATVPINPVFVVIGIAAILLFILIRR
jgi:hypothetical protein